MSKFLDECSRLYGTRNLYELLSIDKDASDKSIKRAYHKLSLEVHPDRVKKENVAEATKKFQILGKVYTVLSDKDKRAVYEETGEVDDDDSCLTQDRDWYDYWRLLFGTVTIDDIKNFESIYKGDIGKIMDSILCATFEDEDRFTEILRKLIEDGELPRYDGFFSEPVRKKKARKRKATEEAAEAEAYKVELGFGQESSLKALIAKNQQSRAQASDDFFEKLQQKYAEPKKSQTKKGQKGKKK
ncbi:hypothetical protein LSH36_232g02016 [Paralvinella palmiformis]|uniref:J domain-containing protein n=1 Tax=Paralvinella palmiformis TaxID=53620 RepID=A0AAD9N3G6_9ANNE|nr:hypothetical protein LSH36_232g02016 [Paralvinella palmiformis]